MTRELTRTMKVTTPDSKIERCDGCSKVIPPGSWVVYRLDGCLFCGDPCAALHANVPLEPQS